MNEVEAIFEPEKVVLIGSSKIQEEIGMASPKLFRNVIHNMRKFFIGETYVVDLHGEADYNLISELPEVPDLAVMMLSATSSAEQAVRCAELGIKSLIIIAGGFKEEQRNELLNLKKEFGTRILGPNTIMGVINTANGLNTTFERDLMPRKGNIAVVSQSGGVGACLLDWSCFYDVGISKFAFVGDKIDVDDVDLMQYYRRDEETKVVCVYVEGVKDGRKFIEEARSIAKSKPVLALKGGITEEAARRAKSHTGSIVGSDEIFDAAFKKAGILRVSDAEQLMSAAVALSKQPPMRGDKVAIVSNVGGPAILAADSVARNNMRLAKLSTETKKKIETLYPRMDASNPLDMIADARAERYAKVLDLVLADAEVDGALVINMLKSSFLEPEDVRVIDEVAAKYPNKPVVDASVGREDFTVLYKILESTNIPTYDLPEKAVKALYFLRRYFKILERSHTTHTDSL